MLGNFTVYGISLCNPTSDTVFYKVHLHDAQLKLSKYISVVECIASHMRALWCIIKTKLLIKDFCGCAYGMLRMQ